jgi:hypothetical protein
MELDRANGIVRDVAEGGDPYTGARLPAGDPSQRAGQGNRPVPNATQSGSTSANADDIPLGPESCPF